MKVAILKEINKPLEHTEIDKPTLELGQILVKIKAAALNHRDVWIQKGQYGGIQLPMVMGSDGSGVVEGTDEEVIINPSIGWGENQAFQDKNFRILGLPDFGTFAEYVAIPKENTAPKPPHLSWEEAAALPLAGLTAYRALFSRCQAQKGEKVLISGIGGGVALFAMQFAIAKGCEVWVTSSSQEKIDKAIALGAKGGANYTHEEFVKYLNVQTGGFDVVIDSAAGDGFMSLIKCCKSGARICFYGGTNGLMNKINPQIIFWKQLTIMGSTMGSSQEFMAMVQFVNEHKIKPVIDTVHELEDIQAAMDSMEKGTQFGKLVVKVDKSWFKKLFS
jgi:NADPH:quinone reductase-like Zn-dependent oxidoreductase